MKTLYSYIQEARGVVTGADSWSKLVDYIINNFTTDDDGEFHCDPKYLPGWMGKCTICMTSEFDDIAAYDDSESSLVKGRMNVYVKVTTKALKNVRRFVSSLEHELQHAYDDYLGRTRKGKTSLMDDKYYVLTGHEGFDYDNLNMWDIMDNPSGCYFDHAFFVCAESTYWFAPTEVNAYLREFSIYLKPIADKGGTFDWKKMRTNTRMDGELPLIGMWLIHHMRDNIKDYTGIKWDFVMEKINETWAPTIFGHTFKGNDANAFCKVLDEIIKKRMQRPMARYIRVIKDSGVKTKNIPDWFK